MRADQSELMETGNRATVAKNATTGTIRNHKKKDTVIRLILNLLTQGEA